MALNVMLVNLFVLHLLHDKAFANYSAEEAACSSCVVWGHMAFDVELLEIQTLLSKILSDLFPSEIPEIK